MYDFIIVHGSYGSPFENWFPWLYNELSDKSKEVLAPQFPCGAELQNYSNWKRVMDAYRPFIGENTTLIGHSLAPAFIVDYLIDNNLKVDKLVFAAPFYGEINIPEFDHVNKPFFIHDDLSKVEQLSNKRICFVSQNDPYVPNDLSLSFSKQINAEVIMVPNAGHFNKAAGYTNFWQLFNVLK